MDKPHQHTPRPGDQSAVQVFDLQNTSTMSSYVFGASPPSSQNALETAVESKQDARIPAFFRFWFTWVEPMINVILFCLIVLLHFAQAADSRDVVHQWLICDLIIRLAAAISPICFIQIFLLRHTEDLAVWRLFQKVILLGDLIYIWGRLLSMYTFGHSVLNLWELDCVLLAFLLFPVALRSLFILGVGTQWRQRTRLVLRWLCASIQWFFGQLDQALGE